MGKVKRSLGSSRKADVTVSWVELVLVPAWRDFHPLFWPRLLTL